MPIPVHKTGCQSVKFGAVQGNILSNQRGRCSLYDLLLGIHIICRFISADDGKRASGDQSSGSSNCQRPISPNRHELKMLQMASLFVIAPDWHNLTSRIVFCWHYPKVSSGCRVRRIRCQLLIFLQVVNPG